MKTLNEYSTIKDNGLENKDTIIFV
jgi:hypothetical protein